MRSIHLHKIKLASLTFTLMLLSISSCRKKQPAENELITTVKISITNGGIPAGVFEWKDPDGDGGNAPLPADTIILDSGINYISNISFLNESNGSTDITEEIRNEGANHLVCYTCSPGIIKVTMADSDGKYPIGLQTEWLTSNKGNASLRIVLRHQPNQKNGSCDPGETDVDVTFPVLLK